MIEGSMLSMYEVAGRLRVSPETVRRWVRLGRLAGVHVGRKVLIAPAEVERVLSSGLAAEREEEAAPEAAPAIAPVYQAYSEAAPAERWTPRIIG
jgi:excisionase family DNA binding protein